MSSTESKSVGIQTPAQEVAQRLAEQSAAFPLPHLVGVEFLRQMLADSRHRTKDGHRLQMQALAKETGNLTTPTATGVASDDEMGGISVQGDTTNTYHITNEAPKAGLTTKLLPWIAAAAIAGGSGLGGAWLWGQFAKPAKQAIPDYQLRLEVKDTP